MNDALVQFDPAGATFEDRGRSNGGHYWFARDFMVMLGYETFSSFEQAINRGIGTCTTLGIPVAENFAQTDRDEAGTKVRDFKLSRFACYLVAMNGDVRKPAVAAAQAYFASLAEAARHYIQAAQDVERVQIRDDLSDRERSLSSLAKHAGVVEYQFFQNEGYRGMYNMNLSALRRLKGLPDGKRLLDFMDKRELAGNLFRLTETEARLKADRVRGQKPAERTAFDVGRKVRKMMIENDGQAPEYLPLAGDINQVKKGLKQAHRELTQIDAPRTKKRLPAKTEG